MNLNPAETAFMRETSSISNQAGSVRSDLDETSFEQFNSNQIQLMESFGNTSSNWSLVFIEKNLQPITLLRIQRCTFNGLIFIRDLIGEIDVADGAALPSGLYDTVFMGMCFISQSCRVSNTAFVSNLYVGSKVGIISCGSVTCKEYVRPSSESFSEEIAITVGSETGGREVTVSAGMNFLAICKQIFSDKGSASVTSKSCTSKCTFSIIGDSTTILRCDRVHNSHFGPNCVISSSSLDSCVLLSSPSKSIVVSAGARLSHCILNESCAATNGCLADHLFMSENSSIGDCARIAHCILGPDSSVAGGECHSSLLGPFVGFHHQSLLIASVWPQGRGNIAYGAKVGANHTGRVSDQECFPGEGIFFGLGCSIKFPSNLLESPYSIITAGSLIPPQQISFPFSLISTVDRPLVSTLTRPLPSGGNIIPQGAITLSPGWVLSSNPYMVDRASKKYSGRSKAVLHRTEYPIMRPWILDQVHSARLRLRSALEKVGDGLDPLEALSVGDVSGLGLCLMAYKDVPKGIKAYTELLQRYALHGLLYVMHRIKSSSTPARESFMHTVQSLQQMPHTSCKSAWTGLMTDLQHFSLDSSIAAQCSGDATQLFQPSYAIADSFNTDVLSHQLYVLSEEYSDMSLSLNRAIEEWSDSGLEDVHLSDSFGVLAVNLLELCKLESSHASSVSACRARDGGKGREVVPDYDEVNSAGADVLSDPIVAAAFARASDVCAAVALLGKIIPVF